MSEQEIAQKINQLSACYSQKDAIIAEKQALIDEIMNAEVRAKLAQIDADYEGKYEAIIAFITALESEVKQDVLSYGSSVKGLHLHAIWNKGRVSWDTKSLDGYATAHPELLPFRREGEPSVSIRSAK